MDNLSQWDQAVSEVSKITTSELDALARAYADARAKYEEAKAVSSKLHAESEEAERLVIEAMAQSGKTKYFVEGVGTLSFVERLSFSTPKTEQDKQAFARFLEARGGKSLFWNSFGINHNTLQAFCKQEYETWKQNAQTTGGSVTFSIPGIEAPVATQTLRLTKERK